MLITNAAMYCELSAPRKANVMRDHGTANKGRQRPVDHEDHKPAAAVVVGVDGSHRAIAAALWAVDEAVNRDIPLRLVFAIEPRPPSSEDIYAAYDIATAEIATQGAVLAVQSCDKPVKLEVEILQGKALDVLIRQSHSAALVCVGALSRERAADHRTTSTAAALSRLAQCPVVVVRGQEYVSGRQGSVVIEFEDSLDFDDVLMQGLSAATLRNAAVRVIACRARQGNGTFRADADVLRAHLEKLLESWRNRHPDTVLDVVVSSSKITEYLAHERDSVQLLVVGRHRKQGLSELIAPLPSATHHSAYSVMIGGLRRAL